MSRKDEPGHHDPEKATARALGLEAGALDAALDDHAVLDGAWASLDAAERAALEALAQLGGAAPVSSVEAEVAAEAADGLDDGQGVLSVFHDYVPRRRTGGGGVQASTRTDARRSSRSDIASV